MSDSVSPTRRRTLIWLLRTSGTALFAALVYPVMAYLKPPKVTGDAVSSVRVGAIDDFTPASGTLFRFGNRPGILIRYEDGSFRAFSATCTHLDCTVQFKKDAGIIWCACHNGKYDLNGRNIDGPPPRPLDEFDVIEKGGEVFVTEA
ncbi:Rieske (2Fe-2S) protein [bacterium]|nr:Rieske (2Fe-2S) protein [bacterium]